MKIPITKNNYLIVADELLFEMARKKVIEYNGYMVVPDYNQEIKKENENADL